MAENAGHEPGPEFDMKEHAKAWLGFMKFMKWLVIASVIVLIILLIWRTNN